MPFDLTKLISDNAAWADAVTAADPTFFHTSATELQEPKILWIGCGDSRVPESVVISTAETDSSIPPSLRRNIGEIFVHRNIANQFLLGDVSATALVSFAIAGLNIEHVVVVGHTACRGITAALEAAREDRLANPSLSADAPLNVWVAPLVALAKEQIVGVLVDSRRRRGHGGPAGRAEREGDSGQLGAERADRECVGSAEARLDPRMALRARQGQAQES